MTDYFPAAAAAAATAAGAAAAPHPELLRAHRHFFFCIWSQLAALPASTVDAAAAAPVREEPQLVGAGAGGASIGSVGPAGKAAWSTTTQHPSYAGWCDFFFIAWD